MISDILAQIYFFVGEGTLRMREDGRWEITLMDGFRSDGKRNIKSFYGKTQKEVRLLLENLPDDRIGWCIRLLLGTGMRTQELLALEPRFIEPDGSVIHIRQAVMMAKGTPVISTPKTNDSTRDVPVPEIVRYCAINLRNTDDTFILEARKKDSPCNPSYFRKKYKEYLERIPNVRLLTPHSCRHTYVSQMQALGVDLDTIRSLVGHASMSMTQHYLHVQEPVRQDAIDRFTQAFGSKPEPPAPDSVVGLPERKPAKDRARSQSYIRPVKGGRSGTKR